LLQFEFVLCVLLAWSIVTKAPPLFAVSLVLLLAVGVSRLWEKYCLTGIEYRRGFSNHRVSFGEEIVMELEIVNRKLLPVFWMEFEDEIPSALRPAVGRVFPCNRHGRSILAGLVALRPYERIRRQYPIHCLARGDHCFGPLLLRSGDLIGMVDCELRVRAEDYLIVYPRILALTDLGLPPRSPLGDLRAQSWLFEDVSRSAGAREYRPGDGLRHIHWPASARSQTLQTRVYETTTSHLLGIFLNVDTDEDEIREGGQADDVLELAITSAASIASWGLERGYQTGIFTNGRQRQSKGYVVVEPASDGAQLERILLALARLQPMEAVSFYRLLSDQFDHLPFGTTVVVVTAALSPLVSAQLLDLRARGHAATVVLAGRGDAPGHIPGVTVRHVGPPESWRDAASLTFSGGNGLER
jgi:uncharacterized protein (DUF58 family)